ncbi:hypothetical protein [Paenibacillus arenosi]|uniref:Uncharacterized protein n=1 Tax=Paenibacillus arenosi TaxID=2774142 RepID=A0ABR9AVD8_9BACL|nr:hypothetical protein [Paenibacillus arenosi]MBD8498092.1 hypothetical protein [Paenibacillus arenosi]
MLHRMITYIASSSERHKRYFREIVHFRFVTVAVELILAIGANDIAHSDK